MYDGVAACKDMLLKFGGHAMACGFTIDPEKIEAFQKALNTGCMLDDSDMLPTIHIDVPMPIHYADCAFVEQLKLLAPFGKANPKPLFAETKLKVTSARVLGKTGNVLRLMLENEAGNTVEAVYFDVAHFLEDITNWFGADECDQMLHGWLNSVSLDVAYYPSVNDYNGTQTIQLMIKYYRKHESYEI